jgi:hypothetical protein
VPAPTCLPYFLPVKRRKKYIDLFTLAGFRLCLRLFVESNKAILKYSHSLRIQKCGKAGINCESNCNFAKNSKWNKVQRNCYAKNGISTIEAAIKQLGMRAELNTLIVFCMPIGWCLSAVLRNIAIWGSSFGRTEGSIL